MAMYVGMTVVYFKWANQIEEGMCSTMHFSVIYPHLLQNKLFFIPTCQFLKRLDLELI